MVDIKQIKINNDSKEADIIFDDDFVTYCGFLDDKNITNYVLQSFLPSNIMLADKEENIIKTKTGYYSYHIIGKIIKIYDNKCVVSVKELKILLDNPPSDMKLYDNISFDAIRIDFIKL